MIITSGKPAECKWNLPCGCWLQTITIQPAAREKPWSNPHRACYSRIHKLKIVNFNLRYSLWRQTRGKKALCFSFHQIQARISFLSRLFRAPGNDWIVTFSNSKKTGSICENLGQHLTVHPSLYKTVTHMHMLSSLIQFDRKAKAMNTCIKPG